MFSSQNPLYYHPLRMQIARSFVRQIAGKLPRRLGLLSSEEMKEIAEKFNPIYNDEIMKFPLKERPESMDRAIEEINIIAKYSEFFNNGRNIFSLSPGLTELLKHTDVGDVVLKHVPFVFHHFYLAFGPQADLEIFPGFFVDGAYIHTLNKNLLDISLTTISKDFLVRPSWFLMPDRHYWLAINGAGEKTVSETYQLAVNEETKVMEESAEGFGDPTKKELRKRIFTAGLPVFRNALNLIINGICYLGYRKSEIRRRHMENAPTNLMAKIEKEQNHKKKRRYQTELELLGYYPIHFCGDSIVPEGSGVKTGREMPTHWRRGHWRNQPCGEGMIERRLIWIMPTIIRPDKGHPESGHTYIVNDEKS